MNHPGAKAHLGSYAAVIRGARYLVRGSEEDEPGVLTRVFVFDFDFDFGRKVEADRPDDLLALVDEGERSPPTLAPSP